MMKHILIYSICTMMAIFQANHMKAQPSDYSPIYPEGKIPNKKTAPTKLKEQVDARTGTNAFVTGISIPSMRHYPAPKASATGSAVIICPGGGYAGLAFQHEGEEVARAFNERGISAFVLKYRLPSDIIMEDKSIGPLQDAQQAIYLVRKNAKAYGIDPKKIGIMGFSAGGHLASTAGTHFKTAKIANPEGISLRPDFMLLLYPVISMDSTITHKGSRENLLGKSPSQETLDLYSNELQVTKDTPPTFLVHADDDKVVPIANSLRFDKALEENQVPHRLITYPNGGHGFGLHNKTAQDVWFDHAMEWLQQENALWSAFEAKSFIKGQDTLPYRILYPENYDSQKSYSVLFVLHGAGERGSNNQNQLVHGAKLFIKPEVRHDYPAIVIFPQCPADSYWSNVDIQTDSAGKRSFHFRKKGKPTKAMKLLMGLLKQTLKAPSTNKEQVYVGGLSMGGMGTYELLRRKPKVFAAAFAICGGDLVQNTKKYQHIPLWIFHGEQDDIVPSRFSHDIVEELQRLGADPNSTFYPEANHNSWDPAFAEPELLPWLFSKRR